MPTCTMPAPRGAPGEANQATVWGSPKKFVKRSPSLIVAHFAVKTVNHLKHPTRPYTVTAAASKSTLHVLITTDLIMWVNYNLRAFMILSY